MSFLSFSFFLIAVFCFYATVQGLQGTNRRLTVLENIIKTQQKQLDDLHAEKNAEIRKLNERIYHLEANTQVNRKQQVNVNEMKVTGNGVKDGVNFKKSSFQPSVNVAFYVYLSGKRCYDNQETFIFDVQETNIGNSYNGNDGIFDVPISGTYVFTVTLASNQSTYVTAEIVVNGQVKGTAFANSDEIHDVHSASGTIVVYANAGDRVFVRRGAATYNCSIFSSATYAWTTFAGWLLFL